jgi:tRNA dimethylallyltransferase
MVARVDPESGRRILPGDRFRLVRALEVFFLTGKPLTEHFAETVSPLDGIDVCAVGLRMPIDRLVERIARRVDAQFARGLVDEVRGLLARGVPEAARPFAGLVYRQVLEHLHGVRDERATRALIVQENRRYARRQLIWFRKEPNLVWIDGAGDHAATFERACETIEARLHAEG